MHGYNLQVHFRTCICTPVSIWRTYSSRQLFFFTRQPCKQWEIGNEEKTYWFADYTPTAISVCDTVLVKMKFSLKRVRSETKQPSLQSHYWREYNKLISCSFPQTAIHTWFLRNNCEFGFFQIEKLCLHWLLQVQSAGGFFLDRNN